MRAVDSTNVNMERAPACRMRFPAVCQHAPTKRPFMQKARLDQTTPWSIIASATFTKPAMLAPCT